MINFIQKNNKLSEVKSSINITYPRTVNIIFGNYPYPEVIHNFIIDIKNNLDPKMENYTNVKGGMTDWKHFNNNDNFKNFIFYLINTHQTTHPVIFQYFLDKYKISDAWGNEIKPNDSLSYHTHPCFHGILYLSKGCDLHLPELNLKLTPEAGDYYIFPPFILHGFPKSDADFNRYSLVFNLSGDNLFNFNKKIEDKYERKNS